MTNRMTNVLGIRKQIYDIGDIYREESKEFSFLELYDPSLIINFVLKIWNKKIRL